MCLNFANENSPLSLLPVKCGKTQVIHSEAVIPSTVSQIPNNVVGLIKPGEKLLDRYYLVGAASLVCPDMEGNIPFRLLNPTDNPVIVFRGATLGHFTSNGLDISPPSCPPLPPPIRQVPPPCNYEPNVQ